jgi:hypothetical protein
MIFPNLLFSEALLENSSMLRECAVPTHTPLVQCPTSLRFGLRAIPHRHLPPSSAIRRQVDRLFWREDGGPVLDKHWTARAVSPELHRCHLAEQDHTSLNPQGAKNFETRVDGTRNWI